MPKRIHFSISTAANAALMGLGNTRRIVLGDTLYEKYSPDEIETILAHEMAVEYAKDHRGKKAVSGAVYGFAGTSLGTEMAKFTMARFLDAMHDLPDDPR